MNLSLFLTTTATTVPTTAPTEELSVESIKSLMDGIDPAKLLPDLSKLFGDLAGICRFAVMIGPVILLVLCLLYLFLAPKEANYYFGYRCYFGMGSIHAWRFTQRLAGLVLGGTGIVLTIVMLLVTGSFGSMEVTDMVWKALNCLIWEAILAVAATLTINLTAMAKFDRRGEYRKKKRPPRKPEA